VVINVTTLLLNTDYRLPITDYDLTKVANNYRLY